MNEVKQEQPDWGPWSVSGVLGLSVCRLIRYSGRRYEYMKDEKGRVMEFASYDKAREAIAKATSPLTP